MALDLDRAAQRAADLEKMQSASRKIQHPPEQAMAIINLGGAKISAPVVCVGDIGTPILDLIVDRVSDAIIAKLRGANILFGEDIAKA